MIEPLNPAMVMPSGMALYNTPPAATTGKQTPVAYKWKGELFTPSEIEMLDVTDAVPLYQHPRQWVGLSVNEARNFYESKLGREALVYTIDEFLEEKNT